MQRKLVSIYTTIIICLLFLLSIQSYGVEKKNIASGLLFKSKTESIDQRTSLDLFNGEYKKFNDNLSISFDLSIWNIQRFGYVFRLIEEDGNELNLVFVNFRGGDNLFFDFNSSRTNQSTQISVSKQFLIERKWFSFQVNLDLSKDQATISLLDQVVTCKGLGLHTPSRFKLIYGLYGINLDVPAMAIKDIRIAEKGQEVYSFPLNEAVGTDVHDRKGKVVGVVKNPTWLINEHFNWKEVARFKANGTAGVTFNTNDQQVIVINKDSINVFDVSTRTLEKQSIEPIPFNIVSGEAMYNHYTNQCYIYNLNDGNSKIPSLAVLDLETKKITHLGDPDLKNRLHHHNAFFNDTNDSLFVFGGYGNFSYSNKVYCYDQASDNWIDIPLSGDTLYPRFFSASGKGCDPSEVLIFGGFGNQSGRQELGGKNLYDLISLNTSTRKVKKLWELNSVDSLFIPCNNLIVDEKRENFYTLCYPHHIAKTTLKLYEFNIKTGAHRVVSNTIPILSEEISTGVYLFFNKTQQEFVAVVREFLDKETSEVRIYLLSSPPVAESELINYKSENYNWWLTIAVVVLVTFGIALIIWNKNKRQVKVQNEPLVEDFSINKIKVKRNAVYVFGDFHVFDRKGVDITYRFSPKIKLLFAILLLNSKDGIEGIPTERISAEVWPDRELSNTKNIRGVTINHLRKILQDMDGIELLYNNQKWRLVINDNFYCDYLETSILMNNILLGQNNLLEDKESLAAIIKRGPLFANLLSTYIDDYRSNFEISMVDSLQLLLADSSKEDAHDKVIILVDILFALDPLNEDVLKIGVRTLRKMDKPQQAKKMYDNFCRRYKSSLGEDYKGGGLSTF